MDRKQLIHINTNSYSYIKYSQEIPLGETVEVSDKDPLTLTNINDSSPKWYKYGDYYYLKDVRKPVPNDKVNNGLNFGELGICYKENYEKIYLRNSANKIVSFNKDLKLNKTIKVNTSLFNGYKYGTTININTKIEDIITNLFSNGPTFTKDDANKVLTVSNDGNTLLFKEIAGGGGGSFDPSNYYTKTETNEKFLIYNSENRVTDANKWWYQGFALTQGASTKNLPPECATYKDKWGVLCFIPENLPNGTGTQIFFPVDGAYKGRIFTRSLTNMRMPGWNPNTSEWYLLSIEQKENPAPVEIKTNSSPQKLNMSPQKIGTTEQPLNVAQQNISSIPQKLETNYSSNIIDKKIDNLVVADASNFESYTNTIYHYFLDLPPVRTLVLDIPQPLLVNNDNLENFNIIDHIINGYNDGYFGKGNKIENEFDFTINLKFLTYGDHINFFSNDSIVLKNLSFTNMNLNDKNNGIFLNIKKENKTPFYPNKNFMGIEKNNLDYTSCLKKGFISVTLRMYGKNWGRVNENDKKRFISINLYIF